MKLVLCLVLIGVNASAMAFDINQCSFMERDAVNSFVPKHWAKIAIGADLLGGFESETPATVAVVDTGLKVAGNADAGAALIASSPEIEYSNHGTAVSGLIASERFGFDPKLKLRVFPVPGERPMFSVSINGEMITPPVFRSDKFCSALELAIADTEVRVINLSFSFPASDCTINAVRKGREAGKIFVFSAGNENLISGPGTEGQRIFKQDPGVFFVGATNYYNSPASFSNYGAAVRMWAPGVDMETLGTGAKRILGTSFAAPLVSAYLAKLYSIYPALKLETLRTILSTTALRKSSSYTVDMINPLHGLTLLQGAKECLESGGSDELCLGLTELKIQRNVSPVVKPETESCEAYASYYQALRKDYFLSNGSGRAIMALLTLFLNSPTAELSFYGDAGFHVNRPVIDRNKAESEANRAFLAGERGPLTPRQAYDLSQMAMKDWSDKKITTDQFRELSGAKLLNRMEPRPQVAQVFEIFCNGVGGHLQDGCADYASSAPIEFRRALGQKIADSLKDWAGYTIYEPNFLWGLGLRDVKVKPSEDPDFPLFAQLFQMTLAGWKGKRALDLGLLTSIADVSTEKESLDLYNKFVAERAAHAITRWDDKPYEDTRLNQWQVAIAWRLSDSALPPSEWAVLRKMSIPEGKIPELGPYLFEAHRVGKGTGNISLMISALDLMLKKAENGNADEWGDDRFQSYAMQEALKNPKLAPALSSYLLANEKERLRLGVLLGIVGYRYDAGELYKTLVSQLPELTATTLRDAFAKDLAALKASEKK